MASFRVHTGGAPELLLSTDGGDGGEISLLPDSSADPALHGIWVVQLSFLSLIHI